MIFLTYILLHSVVLWLLFLIIEVKGVRFLPLLIVGAVVDILYNLIPASILFFKLPKLSGSKKEITFSQRMKAYVRRDDWRGNFAKWICNTLLDKFLPGHCKQNA